MNTSSTTLYEIDFYCWTSDQAQLLRSGQFSQLDIDNLVEEIETMGRSERRSLESRLAVLLMHLLKWQYQLDYRCRSWMLTIQEQRIGVRRIIRDSLSLKYILAQTIDSAWEEARVKAEKETRIHQSTFPTHCLWSFEQMLDDRFWPEADSLSNTASSSS